MREIKFRVWDKTSNCMLYQDDFERVEIDTKNKMVVLIADEESDKSHYALDYEDRIEADILQYTGLKDKNGKEIYEGDIVEIISQVTMRYEKGKIIFDCGCYFVNYGWNTHLLFEFLNDIKVVGNIYENQELLEE